MANTYRSNFERQVALFLKKKKIKYGYETTKFHFEQPAKKRVYIPDFELPVVGTFVECKGKLTKQDRDKLLWAREQNPNLRLIILFMRANNYIRKGSKTRYKDWAEKEGFLWADWETGKNVKELIK